MPIFFYKDILLKQKIPVIILLVLSLLLITYITPSFLHNKQHEISNNQLVASHIYGLIAGSVERPIGISTGLSSDEFLIRALEQEEETNPKAMEAMMSSFLSAITNQFGYAATFVVSEKTKRFYTPTGIAKIVNPQDDPYDNWYPIFIDNGLDVAVETDRDQLFDYRWSIFINARIKDDAGNTLGVCRIGLFMEDFQKMLQEVEKEYQVKINLIDTQGLVQVDTNFNNIKNAYISDALSDGANDKAFTHVKKGKSGFRMTRYMPSLRWYLVVQGNNIIQAQTKGIISIVLIYFFIIHAILYFLFDQKKVQHHDLVKSSLPEDELTGLPNRNYLKESYGELGVFNTTRYKSLVELAKTALDDRGIMFRWSGDEFVLFLEMDSYEAEERFTDFCEQSQKELDVTVSVGIVDVDLSVSIKTNYYRAVQACYAVKEAGGNGVGKR